MSEWGQRAEEEARRLAGRLGVADLVYHPRNDPRANREIGDGILAVGDDGLILQVKARDPERGAVDSVDKAARWVMKNAKKASRQANGTRRRLNLQPMSLESVRGYERVFEPPCDWKGVVIIDHPQVPEELVLPDEPDTMWITLDDWYALHERLRSTAAVIEYVDRAVESGVRVPLGQEQVRYDNLAAGDSELAAQRGTRPRLPEMSLSRAEMSHAAFFDEVIDLVHDKDDAYVPWIDPDEYRRIVEVLDRIPPGVRVELGMKLRELFLRMRDAKWWVSSFVYDKTQNLVLVMAFDLASNWDQPESFMAQLGALTSVRLCSAEEDDLHPRAGLGVGVLNHGKAGRSRWYVYMDVTDGGIDVPVDVRYELESRFGKLLDGEIVRLPTPRRNDLCPCGSSKKYKRCHGSAG